MYQTQIDSKLDLDNMELEFNNSKTNPRSHKPVNKPLLSQQVFANFRSTV